MIYFCICAVIGCLVIVSGVLTFVVFEARIITELQKSMTIERNAYQDTNIALQKVHNDIIESQKRVVDRMDTLELRMAGLSSAIPAQRKY